MSKIESKRYNTKQKLLGDVLNPRNAKELWGAGYEYVLPIIPGDFAMGGVLPAVFYMMRWGYRRGKGKFISVYGNPDGIKQKEKAPTIYMVTSKLLENDIRLEGFQEDVHKAILSDLILAFCLENKKHFPGREQPIQRVFPTHYYSSWIDLPNILATLRGVPEFIVSILANQKKEDRIQIGNHKGYFSVGSNFEDNLLLKIFGKGTSIKGQRDNLLSDFFDESTLIGIDQLLTIRIAQLLGEAPRKASGESSPIIPNQIPAAKLASEYFYEDLNVFLRAYGQYIPRQSLLPMLESCFSLGLTNIFFSTIKVMFEWERCGTLPEKKEHAPWPVFIDCSISSDTQIRNLSEESMDDLIARLTRIPIIMMSFRILDQWARRRKLDIPSPFPDPTERINFLGNLLKGNHNESHKLKDDLSMICYDLSEALKEVDKLETSPEESHDFKRDIGKKSNKLLEDFKKIDEILSVQILENEKIHPVLRLAETIVLLMGDKSHFQKFSKLLYSCLMTDLPNGIGRSRKSRIQGKSTERRSIVLTNTVLDFLVHRHLREAKKDTPQSDLSLSEFITVLQERYGFYIDESPHGLSVPADILKKNRAYLERRLRDLGLFIGVNDAESMKRLRQRFKCENNMGEAFKNE